MTAVVRYTTKKALKERLGKSVDVVETSLFGKEYPPSGTGTVYVVGPAADDRRYYAKLTLKDHILAKVD